jgi:hypothetical protein
MFSPSVRDSFAAIFRLRAVSSSAPAADTDMLVTGERIILN